MSFISWFRSQRKASRCPSSVGNPFRGRLAFERLEDRRLLATALNPGGNTWLPTDGLEPIDTTILYNQPADSNPSLVRLDNSIAPTTAAVPWNDPNAQDWADWISQLSLAPTTAEHGPSWLLVSESGAWTQFAVSIDPATAVQQIVPVATGTSSPDANEAGASASLPAVSIVTIGAWIEIEPPVAPSAVSVSTGSTDNPSGPIDESAILIGAGELQDGGVAWVWTHSSPSQNGDPSASDGIDNGGHSGGNNQTNSWSVNGVATSSDNTATTVSRITTDTVFQIGPHDGTGDDGHHHADGGGTNDTGNGDTTDGSDSGALAERHVGHHHDGNHHHDDQDSQNNNGDPSQNGDSNGDLGADGGDSTDTGASSDDGSANANSSDDDLSVVGTGSVGATPHHHGGHHGHRLAVDTSMEVDGVDTTGPINFTADTSISDGSTDLNFTTEIDDVTPPPTALPQASTKPLDLVNPERWSFLAIAMGDRLSNQSVFLPITVAGTTNRGDVGSEILESGHFVFVGATNSGVEIRGARRVLSKAAGNQITSIIASNHTPLATSALAGITSMRIVVPIRGPESSIDSIFFSRAQARFTESTSTDALMHAPLYVQALKTVDEQQGASNRLDQIGWWGIVSQFVLAPQFPRNHQPTIMLAVADEASRDAMNVALVKANFLVLTAATARDAINLLRTPLSPIDVALLDVHLPDVNGVDLCSRLREMYPKLPVLVCADRVPGHDDVAQLNRMDVQRIFAKPVAINDLLAAVKSIVS